MSKRLYLNGTYKAFSYGHFFLCNQRAICLKCKSLHTQQYHTFYPCGESFIPSSIPKTIHTSRPYTHSHKRNEKMEVKEHYAF